MPYAAGDTQALTPGFRIRNVQLDSNLLEFSITRPQVSALSTEEHAKAETFVRQALTAALKADELTKADRRRVVDLIKADFADAKNALKSHGLVASTYTNLQLRMDQAARAVSSQTALGRGEPSLDEIFDSMGS